MCPVYYTSFFVFFSNGLNEYLRTKVPNYLNYIYLDALAEVKPEAIIIY